MRENICATMLQAHYQIKEKQTSWHLPELYAVQNFVDFPTYINELDKKSAPKHKKQAAMKN